MHKSGGRLMTGAILAVIILAAGCQSRVEFYGEQMALLGQDQLYTIVRQNVKTVGGLDRWAQVERIEADVVATISDADKGESLVRQRIILEPGRHVEVTVISREPDGITIEKMDKKGRVSICRHQGDDEIDQTDPAALQGAALKLRLLAQAMTQGPGLLQKDYMLRYLGQERKGGRMDEKVEASGPLFYRKKKESHAAVRDLLVVWVDSQKHTFDRMWVLCHLPHGLTEEKTAYLAANMSKYEKTPEGLVLPRYIEFVRSDEHQQFSESQMMILEFKDVQVIFED